MIRLRHSVTNNNLPRYHLGKLMLSLTKKSRTGLNEEMSYFINLKVIIMLIMNIIANTNNTKVFFSIYPLTHSHQ